jgi:outer membrane protein assembly factor BamB
MKQAMLWLRTSGVLMGLGVLCPAVVFGADWPQWRGPHRDGHSSETGLLKEWPKEGPKVLWKVGDLGLGYSTPSIVGKRIYLLSNQGLDNESVLALDAADGKKVWETRVGKVGNPKQQPSYPASRSTPTVDGNSLYALGSDGDLVCLESGNGKVRWQKNLRTDFGGEPGIWAYAESPLVDGDLVVCTPGGTNATIVALKKGTGDTAWKSAMPQGDQAAYASIIVMKAAGRKQYVQFLQKGLVGLDAANGSVLWRYEKTAKNSPANIPTPVADDGYVYSAAGRSGGGLIKVKAVEGKADQLFEAEQVYFSPKLPVAIGGSIKVGKYLYGTTLQALVCADFVTGEIKWEDRSIASASLCYADDRLYLHGENGDLALVEPTEKGYVEKGRFTPPEQPDRGQSKAWTYPAIADGRLYIRDANVLWCYDIRGKKD